MQKENEQNILTKIRNQNFLKKIKIKDEKLDSPRRNTRKRSVESSNNSRYDLEGGKFSKTTDVKSMIKNDSMILYKDKLKNSQMNIKKENSMSDLITNSIDYNNDKTTDSHSFFSNFKMKSKLPTSGGTGMSLAAKYKNINRIKIKKKKSKKVTFKKKFVTYVDVESYKQYNLENCCLNDNDKTETKCTCFIY